MGTTKEEHIGFKRFVVFTVVSVYLLILAGGIVRTTGSGMGCPDWPRCFGKWIPPTKVSQLPSNYQELYSVHGYIEDFNPLKTWIEYINRLLGALIGIFSLLVFVLSLKFKSDKAIPRLSGLVLLMVIAEGIVGKYVVSTNLKPLIITFHMWGSIVIILLLIYIMTRLRKDDLITGKVEDFQKVKKINVLLIVFTIVQVFIGTQVRQQIDNISVMLGFGKRDLWISQLGSEIDLHRLFSVFLFFFHIYFIYVLRKSSTSKIFNYSSSALIVLLFVEMSAGIIMSSFNIPAFLQPIHMLSASLILGVQFFILYVLNFNNSDVKIKIVEN